MTEKHIVVSLTLLETEICKILLFSYHTLISDFNKISGAECKIWQQSSMTPICHSEVMHVHAIPHLSYRNWPISDDDMYSGPPCRNKQ